MQCYVIELTLRNKGFQEFALTIFPRTQCKTLTPIRHLPAQH